MSTKIEAAGASMSAATTNTNGAAKPPETAIGARPDANPTSPAIGTVVVGSEQTAPAAGTTDVDQPQAEAPAAGMKYKFDLLPPPAECYADGAHGVTVGRNVLKLDLYSVVRVDQANNEEIRNISQRIVMPLTAVRELASLLDGIMRASQEAAKQQNADAAKPEKSAAA